MHYRAKQSLRSRSWPLQQWALGIMENEMETTIVCWGNIGIMENRIETTIMGFFRV